jgi:pimeloyl-ACP methyl ester carboxylesterase
MTASTGACATLSRLKVAAASVMSQYWAPRYLTSEAVQRTSHDLRRATWEGSIGSLRAMVRQDYTPYLSEVSHPSLVICGERDFTIPPGDSRLAASILPDARLMMLKGIHHQPVDECPAEFLNAVQSFLSAETHPNGKHARHLEAAP